ncbi:dolichyl-phosphate-mannose--protein mannosyltransferase [Streptomyces lonarensis]|uniref:Polyprenol-phosphate-mannose--protein mannosyltransferase n=1 Tax=Streptomyces lonarensis TaxID=700599 RepID=A0A7X6D0W8_9ACTN|nr:phospholipid carrier-dependent glycosyltransferase [Streptomyces lonarensis]NJQ05963.1 phospholipid carrier-dependent glycosyltransferase [Streptomyces lonarensis]
MRHEPELPGYLVPRHAAGPPGTGPPPPERDWVRGLRRHGYRARADRGVRDRLVPPYPPPAGRLGRYFGLGPTATLLLSRWAGWIGPLLVGLFAGALRFVNLGSPHAVVFDETYYAKDAWALLQRGHEISWPDDANERILSGDIPLGDTASYVVHPPVGKWVIALGEWAFGMEPFGWRFMTALLGALSVVMVCRIGRRLFRSTALGCLAGVLLALDGLHFVMSRTALLDLVLMFWVLAAFGALLVDRDRTRARFVTALEAAQPAGGADGVLRPVREVGERLTLGLRPWRLAAGLLLGLACATKWSGLYALAAFGILIVLWDAAARRTAGARRPYRAMLRRDAVPAFVSTVPVAAVTYLASWAGWFATAGGYYRQWGAENGSTGNGAVDALRSWWHYHREAYSFHVGLTDSHAYDSNPWSWLVSSRPVSFHYQSIQVGQGDCEAEEGCAREVLALGTPVLWWAACLALVYVAYRWLLRRDWRAGAVLCGVACGYLPWFLYQERTIFYFYSVVLVPFLCLAVAMALGAVLGPPGCSERRRAAGIVATGVFVLAVAWNFVYFYPLYTGIEIPMDAWRARMWLDTWV